MVKYIHCKQELAVCDKPDKDSENLPLWSDERMLEVLMDLPSDDLFYFLRAQIESTDRLIKLIRQAKDENEINDCIDSYYEDLQFIKGFIRLKLKCSPEEES